MTKAGSSLGGGSTVQARQAIRQAENDSKVKAIVLQIDSPGGTVSGTKDLADAVANSKKPVIAFVEDLCCSAAMWVASQASEIYANNATATIGSIGTFMGLYDLSKALENEGIKAVVVKAGEFKGGGFPGTEITDAQVAQWQKQIDQLQIEFTKGIASGRKMDVEDAASLATGQTWLAKEAVKLKLIDGIKTFDQVVTELRSRFSSKGSTKMSESTSQPAATPQPATLAELKAACPGASADFLIKMQEQNATVATATTAFIQQLQADKNAAEAKAAEAATKASVEKVVQTAPVGTASVSADASNQPQVSDDPVSAYEDAVFKATKDYNGDKAAATRFVVRTNPQLHQNYLAAFSKMTQSQKDARRRRNLGLKLASVID